MHGRTRSLLAALCLLTPALALAGFAGTDLFLPNVGRQAGIFPSNWYTTVWIYNPGTDAATARIYLLVRNTANLAPPYVDVQVPAGDTVKQENVVESLFHQQVFGALRVTCDTQKLVVTSRVYSKGSGAGENDSVGQDFAGVPASFAIGNGESTQVLGVHQTEPAALSDYRFNFGFVETTGHSAGVTVTAYDEDGRSLGSTPSLQVREFSQRQLAFKDYFPTVSSENVRLQVAVTSGTGKIIAFGSGIANASQDPTTFEMQYKDALLGISTVQHDTTLTGDGTAGAPLGLADGAVTQAKLATTVASGSGVQAQVATPTTGQVLGTTGTSLVWQNAAAGDITAVDTAAGSGLTGGVASGAANLAIAPGGVTTPMLADGAVTVAKMSPTGSSSGKVLTSTGNAVVWQSPSGLTLPFVGTDNSPTSSFAVTNNGAGYAIEGLTTGTGIAGVVGGGQNNLLGVAGFSATGSGVYGSSGSYPIFGVFPDAGVYGTSDQGFGVLGKSSNSDGVRGSTQASNASGVHGESPYWGVFGTNTSNATNGCLGCFTAGAVGYTSDGSLYGILGTNVAGGVGISGASTSSSGITGTGVQGTSTSGDGVAGFSSTGDGVYGQNQATHADGCVGCPTAGIIGYQGNSSHAGQFTGNVQVSSLASGGVQAVYATPSGQLTLPVSDARLKKNVVDLSDEVDVVEALQRLRGVTFNWDTSVDRARLLGDQREIGMLAQEVEAVLPELVTVGTDGYRSLDYGKLSAFLVEVAKAQQAQIRSEQAAIAALQQKVHRLETASAPRQTR